MKNYNNTDEEIKNGFESGIITEEDYNKWQGLKGYISMLQKSEEDGDISKAVFENEIAKAKGYYFERDKSFNTLRFTLHGPADHTPMDLFKQKEILKSIQNKPLQDKQQTRVDDSMKEINALADEICKMNEDMKKRKSNK